MIPSPSKNPPEALDARAIGAPLFSVWALLAAAIFTVFTVRLISFAELFPYFFMFDMDRFVLTDYLRVRNGEIPNQLHHPSFGLYPVFRLTEAIWRIVEAVPGYNYQNLVDSLSPAFVVAELMSFLRAHSPFIAVLSAALMAFAVGRGFETGWRRFMALLLVSLSGPWLIYQAAMIRSELYGVFYWSAGLASLALAARSRAFWPSTGWLFVGGAFLGLSFLSKTQTFLLIALAPVFYFHVLWAQSHLRGRDIWLPLARPRTVTVVAGAFALGLALIFFAVAPSFPVPEGAFAGKYFQGGQATYGIARQFVIFCGLTAIAVVLALAPASFWRRVVSGYSWATTDAIENPVVHVGHIVVVLAAGFVGIAIIHLALGPDLIKSAEHMVLDFKVTMLRLESFRLRKAHEGIDITTILFTDRPVPAILYASSVVAAVSAAVLCKPRHHKSIVILILATAAVLLFQILQVLRPEPKDWVFYDVGFYVFGAVNYSTVLIVSKPSRPMITALGLIATVALVDNLRAGAIMKDYLSVNYQLYGWRRLQFFDFGWIEQSDGYFSIKDMIAGRYGEIDNGKAGEIVDHARRHKKILHDARFVVSNQTVTGARIGLAIMGQGVWANEAEWRIARLPEFMIGATVVDTRAGPIDAQTPRWKPVRYDRVRIQQAEKSAVGQNLALLARTDLGVYLFLPESKLTELGKIDGASVTDHVIQLEKSKGDRSSFRGVRVNGYALFPWVHLRQSFLVITDDSRDLTTVAR